jgi:hypothetical protein
VDARHGIDPLFESDDVELVVNEKLDELFL